jgi:glutaminyl-tRNA synthetase
MEKNIMHDATDFISEFIKEDMAAGRFDRVHTRFPPEPNGWLHIGHIKAISIDYNAAKRFGGIFNLRFDDTNPEKENIDYVNAIKRDMTWLGFDWGANEFYASDYYEYLYDLALKIIKKGLAYVDDLSEEEIRQYRGTAVPDKNNITETPPGKNSPYRERGIEENLDLFARMRAGEFPDGAKTLRAKIDMTHANLVMRDPVMYRIRRETHYRTGDDWCIYPMYDFQHPLSDAKEGITHSLCSMEYEIHRPLYDWFIREAEVFPSRQIEFARLNLTHTVMSKRWLLALVTEGLVSGWDDPRMPTIAGLRRRGYTPEALKDFVARVGVAKTDSMVEIALLEHCLREDLNKRARRVMVVLRPLKVVISNWDDGKVDELDAVNNPEDESAGTRKIKFTRELYIDYSDFEEVPPAGYRRLYPGGYVRLRYGYIIKCIGYRFDDDRNILELKCTVDKETRGGNAADNSKVRGTIQWVSALDAVKIEVRSYDHLFLPERPMEVSEGKTFRDNLNPASLEVITDALAEPCLVNAKPGENYQAERVGYLVLDGDSERENKLIFNKTIGLRDTWGKIQKKGNA